ncbi:hypothetical protein BUZ61_10845 [Staphylococcus nepalensis]|jgi:hypothetical protein|uniref:Lipoprotein n=1 Tax=Staphylococcus nepalensis TaxID=214473 RepID=A0A2T4S8J8_9STAP|nr:MULTISPECIES: hypothetical protein [Staphylococcus]PTJ75068.1 hypothetical protein BUZ59_10610 [Staphylococcus kloosii]PTK58062.1 hypothetical protein BUZ61_10845 [Staphylococcus nepalensis]PUZ34431.1 hypothetical protein BUY27_07760 [Staphylococcus cohnii]RIO27852.1 hypothetical protein BUZ80_11340 [Staphylococcus saprophyticus]
MKKVLLLSLVIVLSFILAACGNAQDKAQGKWSYKEDGTKITLRIEDDDAELKSMGLTIDGEVKNVEKDTFSVKLENDENIKFKVNGDKLKDEDDNVWKKED